MQKNPFYEPGFTRNNAETKAAELEITGNIPEWLNGLLIRNGPGLVQSDKLVNHWFDGLAMLHRFDIHNGKVGYRSRFLDCGAYQAVKETGKIAYSEFATDPCKSLFQKVQTFFSGGPAITDSAKVNIAEWQGRAFALGEPLMQAEFDKNTLERIGVFNYNQSANTGVTTAHPHIEGERLYNLVQKFGARSYYQILSSDGKSTRKEASVGISEPAYLHSFGMSRRHFIIAEGPLVVYPLNLLAGARPFIENFKWKPNRGSQFYIFDRTTGKLAHQFRTKPFFSFHHVNAFEEDDRIVMDMVIYEDASIIQHYYLNRLADTALELPHGRLCRISYHTRTKEVTFDYLSAQCIELSHFDYAYGFSRPDYRYVYGISLQPEKQQDFYNQLIKIDIASRQELTWKADGCYPGEPVFVPAPGRQSEDDGILLSVVLSTQEEASFLLVLDAKNMKETGRAKLPQQVLFGFHGVFFQN
jgi:carotenoid cleavage dioxygenase-like enzyme